MATLPRHLKLPSFVEKAEIWAGHYLNFYRIHMICFTIIPTVFAAIMYACNTTYHIPFLDCLFLCFSSMCVTGLATVDLSTLSTFQQFIMYFQMLIGSMIFVSILMLSVRKHFFRVKFRHVLNERNRKQRALDIARTITTLPKTTTNQLRKRFTRGTRTDEEEVPRTEPPKKKKGPVKLTKDMIQRVDGGGVGLVNPMGWYDGATPDHSRLASRAVSPDPEAKEHGVGVDDVAKNSKPQPLHTTQRAESSMPSVRSSEGSKHKVVSDSTDSGEEVHRRLSASTTASSSNGFDKESDEGKVYSGGADLRQILTTDTLPLSRTQTESIGIRTPYATGPAPEDAFPRSKTIAFDDAEDGLEHVLHPGREPSYFPRTPTMRSDNNNSRGPQLTRTQSMFMDTKNENFGGFPTPLKIVSDLASRMFPKASTKLQQTLTMPRTSTLSGREDNGQGRNVNYISFSATVGRNSDFQNLTDDQMEELGGVEYRALNMLFWIVLIYWLFLPLAGATIIAPYIAAGGRYDHVFDDQPKHVRIPWFAFFQATSAFSNSGTSLVDQSMIPFQRAYVMSAFMMVLILMGNTCYPICLRFIIWVLFKTFPKGSQTRETLKFLLDHPRRCFVYLFPSTQTWFLLFVVIVLTCIDWVSFLVLDLGTPVIMEIPKGTRVAAGLFQSIAVRAAGFAIVPMNDLAPAVKVMYVIMMYISVYPIAMSVRSTNVYEERALGVFDDDDENEEDEDAFEHREGAHAVAKYLGWHARRQLAFDMWWVVLSLWLVCIIERGALNDPAKHNWMNIFNILFELVSAYGTVGLSLGVPFDNYSLSGAFRKLSKLIVIVVMLRGRHRGLPLAIDRAVMLPKDFTQSDERAFESRIRRSRSRRASSMDVMSQGSAFPRTFTAMSDAQQQTSVVPSSPRLPARERDSSPSAPFRRHERTLSQTSSTDTPPTNAASGPLTPTSLHFAIGPNPRAAFPAAHLSSFNSLGGGAASGTSGATGTSPSSGIPSSHAGILSPVHEDPHSRRGTITEISGTEAVGGGNRNVDEGEHVHVRDFAVETPLHSPVDETTPTGSPRDTMSGTTTAASSNSATAVSN